MANRYIAGVGKALLFKNNQLVGVGKTYTESTFNFSTDKGEIRGGAGNALIGQYFYNSSLGVTITDACFNLETIALNLGVGIEQGGVVFYESTGAGDVTGAGGVITLTEEPVAFDGAKMAWYKKPTDEQWNMTTIGVGNTITIPGADEGEHYCVKYPYEAICARHVVVKTQFAPAVVHLVLINDIFSSDTTNAGNSSKCGALITDIPQFQLSGSQEISATPTSSATQALTGNAMAVLDGVGCEDDPYYGTITECIFDTDWCQSVIALAPVDADMELAVGDTKVGQIYAVFGGMTASRLIDPKEFVWAVESGTAVTVDATTGLITAAEAGEAIVSATVANDKVDPAIIRVTVA